MVVLPKITSAFLNLTNACNLACRYCFVHQNPTYISLETAKDAADWLYQNWEANGKQHNVGINYFGGEPLLCWESVIVPLTEYIRRTYGEEFRLSITTNGILLDEERLEFLRKHKVSPLLSMDGDKETQDEQRPTHAGGSSFDLLEPKLDMILHYFPDIGFRSTITPKSAPLLFHNLSFVESRGFTTWFGMPNDFETWALADIEVLRGEVRKLGNHFIERCRNGERPIRFTSFERMFAAICHINSAIEQGVDRDIDRCSSCYRCGLGGTHYAAIDTEGRVFACQDMCSFATEESPFYLGSIYQGIDDARRKALMADYDSRRCHGKDCTQCRLSRICDGGCVANNYMVNADIRHVPEIHCEWYQMLLEEAIRVMGILGAEGNQTFSQIWREQNG